MLALKIFRKAAPALPVPSAAPAATPLLALAVLIVAVAAIGVLAYLAVIKTTCRKIKTTAHETTMTGFHDLRHWNSRAKPRPSAPAATGRPLDRAPSETMA